MSNRRVGLVAALAIMVAGSSAAAQAATAPLPAARFDDGPIIAQADLVADFDAWMAGMREINPNLALRSDMPTLEREAAAIRRSLDRPMTRREAWLHFARLNPYLRDAHAGVQMPDYRGALAAHLKAGGHVVPLEVRFDRDGALRIFTVAPGMDPIAPGDRLVSIDGHDAGTMAARMMSLAIGETPAFRRAFVERRFAMLYAYLYGDTGQYDVVARQASGRLATARAGGDSLPEALQPEPDADTLFAWRLLPGDIGYLRVDAFDPSQKEALARVATAAFTAFKATNVRALIIDVRENGGGDDPLWQQQLMNHFTTRPYVQLSHFVTRVTKGNASPGDVIGTVQSADYHKRFTPPADDPIRFGGPVYILAGPYSYSATIQFLVAAQDFGAAKIAGEETAALSCQTGQVTRIPLPRTGLSASTPITDYTRPSGKGCDHGVMPDVAISIDEVAPDRTLEALAAWIRAHG